jgi:DNA-binding GntR family transcriptional regulator
MIYRGELAAGKRLVERELAELLMISRIPLREALIRLQSEGLVLSSRSTGAYVVDFSPKDLAEIYSLRRVLEPFAAGLFAERKDQQQVLQDLREICQRMSEVAVDERAWDNLDECDFEFHWLIVQASRHTRLIRAYDMSQIRILGRRDQYRYLKTVSPTATAKMHLKLLDVLALGNGPKAEKAFFEHVDHAMKGFLRTYGLSKV